MAVVEAAETIDQITRQGVGARAHQDIRMYGLGLAGFAVVGIVGRITRGNDDPVGVEAVAEGKENLIV